MFSIPQGRPKGDGYFLCVFFFSSPAPPPITSALGRLRLSTKRHRVKLGDVPYLKPRKGPDPKEIGQPPTCEFNVTLPLINMEPDVRGLQKTIIPFKGTPVRFHAN